MFQRSLVRYWGCKPGILIESIFKSIDYNGGIVLDLFGGTGSTVYAAAKLGYHAIYNDINPLAFLISYLHISKLPGYSEIYKDCLSIISDAKNNYENNNVKIPKRVSNAYLMYPNGKKFLKQRHFIKIADFFYEESLYKLSALYNAIANYINANEFNIHKSLFFIGIFASIIFNSSKMARPNGGTWPVNSYWIPKTTIIKDPFELFIRNCKRIYNSKTRLGSFPIQFINMKKKYPLNFTNERKNESKVYFSLSNAISLLKFFNGINISVDVIVADPPFTDEIQYFELSYLTNVWIHDLLKLVIGNNFVIKTKFYREEMIVNKNANKSLDNYFRSLYKLLKFSYRVLRPQGHFILMFHAEEDEIFKKIVNICRRSKYKLVNVAKYNMNISPFDKKNNSKRTLLNVFFLQKII